MRTIFKINLILRIDQKLSDSQKVYSKNIKLGKQKLTGINKCIEIYVIDLQ